MMFRCETLWQRVVMITWREWLLVNDDGFWTTSLSCSTMAQRAEVSRIVGRIADFFFFLFFCFLRTIRTISFFFFFF